ncbi:MAG: R3H domain-containing nucleic acid-binding protein [Patescibacteria group bacterium]
MEQLQVIIKQIIEGMGFSDYSLSYDKESNRVSLIIDDQIFSKNLADFVFDLNQVVKLVAKKNGWEPVVIDVNNYRRQRHELILELARAAARKTVATKEEIALPPMNAYERRLIHVELAGRPDLKTESIGEGKERGVIVKPI